MEKNCIERGHRDRVGEEGKKTETTRVESINQFESFSRTDEQAEETACTPPHGRQKEVQVARGSRCIKAENIIGFWN